jgi:hypothetical protein
MSRAAPPGIGSGRLGLNPGGHRERKKLASRYYNSLSSFTSSYSHLLTRRYAERLLRPFRCHRCGSQTLDPLGFDGPHKPLCWRCAQ